jgi:hypothetical protein
MLAHRSFALAAIIAAGLANAALAAPPADGSASSAERAAPGNAAFTYFAVVSKVGRLGRRVGAVSATHLGTGHYLVDFNLNVSQCSFVATLGRASTAGGAYEQASYVSVTGAVGDSNGVFVESRGVRGRLRDRPFHLLVAC